MRSRVLLTPEHRAEGMYLSVPFEMAAGTSSFEVRLSYDDSTGARVDLGCEGPAGWRGWSGGARRRFVIAAASATWGYLAGELEPGTWNVVLGLHVIPDGGVSVEIEIDAPGGAVLPDPASDPPLVTRSPGRADLPAPRGMRWFACDFHAHTLHSDGSQSIGQLARLAAARGLDAIAITDHNTVSHHAHLRTHGARHDITLIPGQEVTTARGHANALGEMPWIDFRGHPNEWHNAVHDAGGILSINHPVSGDCSWQWGLDRQPTHAEIFHSSWLRRPEDTSVWAWWSTRGPLIPLGGSDFHYPESGVRPGAPTTWVAAEERSSGAILEGVRAGRVALSRAPSGPMILHLGDRLLVTDADGAVVHDAEGRRQVIRSDRVLLPAAPEQRYHLESAARHILALTGSGDGALQ